MRPLRAGPRIGFALAAVLLLLTAAASAPAQQLSLTLDDLAAPGFSVQGLKATLANRYSELVLEIDAVTVAGRSWRKVRVHCPQLRMDTSAIACLRGTLDAADKLELEFTYLTALRRLDVAVRPSPEETWRLRATFTVSGTAAELSVERGKLKHLVPWIPLGEWRINDGEVSGNVALAPDGAVTGELLVTRLAFSDVAGLHAGEKIRSTLSFAARRSGARWQWRAKLDWNDGEIFWQPVYLKGGGHGADLEGQADAAQVRVAQGRIRIAGVGEAEVAGTWDLHKGVLADVDLRTDSLSLGPVYETLLKPFLQQTAAADLRAEGGVSLVLEMRDQTIREATLNLRQVSIEDRGRRFGLFGLDGSVPWRRDARTVASVALQGGEVLRLPFGAFTVPIAMHGEQFEVAQFVVPLLDGALTVTDLVAVNAPGGWRWQLGAQLAPLAMEQLTQALALPTMHGTLAATIPVVTYAQSTLAADGALIFNVFDGTAKLEGLRLVEPFGRAPRLAASLDMKGLDLDLVTRAFSFGRITGRIDARVADLELANWQPVKFDSRIESSAGDYPRKISQRAVQNISALGGVGAAAAIQRSFLRFFEEFGYEKLGLSCSLRNSVCDMGGIEDAPYGYVIVKGGGIPAISVIGYNRRVNWDELIARLKRVTQENVHAVVQ